MVEGQPDRLAYFKELVAQDTLGQAQYLPRSASQWVQPDGQMVEAADMVGSLANASENMEEPHLLIEEIEAAISGDNRYEFFKESRGGWAAANAFDNTLMSIQRDINEAEYEVSGGSSSAARDERLREEERYDDLPQTREEIAERERAYQVAVEERQLNA